MRNPTPSQQDGEVFHVHRHTAFGPIHDWYGSRAAPCLAMNQSMHCPAMVLVFCTRFAPSGRQRSVILQQAGFAQAKGAVKSIYHGRFQDVLSCEVYSGDAVCCSDRIPGKDVRT
eukprot:XP_001691532.1 predicted protein [Chlamydomonas reinhardtii]